MNPIEFSTPDASHAHALETLNALYEYDDFMLSIDTLLDVGCGDGKDLEWWATRTTRDTENPEPLDIKCTGIDLAPGLKLDNEYDNIDFLSRNFEQPFEDEYDPYDIIWSHNSFQYAINPLQALKTFNWMLSPGGMLAIIIPQTTNIVYNRQAFSQLDCTYYNHTLVSLIHMLAVNGFDCKNGFFKKEPDDAWISLVVYKSDVEPMDPAITRWYDLVDLKLLPDSADVSIHKFGHLRQQDLVLPWLDKSNTDFSRH